MPRCLSPTLRMPCIAVGLTGALVMVGCGHAHPEPDPSLVSDLSSAIVADLHGMSQPALSDRSLRDQAVQLAWTADPSRIAAIRSGALGQAQLCSEARRIVQRIASAGGTAQAPAVLVWLLRSGSGEHATLSTADRELLDCLRAEAELELPRQRSPAHLPP
jgi:hypothetical protein